MFCLHLLKKKQKTLYFWHNSKDSLTFSKELTALYKRLTEQCLNLVFYSLDYLHYITLLKTRTRTYVIYFYLLAISIPITENVFFQKFWIIISGRNLRNMLYFIHICNFINRQLISMLTVSIHDTCFLNKYHVTFLAWQLSIYCYRGVKILK